MTTDAGTTGVAPTPTNVLEGKNHNGLDLLDIFKTTVFENKALHEGASTAMIRKDFQKWARTVILEEQGCFA
ncbi:uncharacterized protein N7498_005349 [Penicillium cinerascens]|uniref:Uncharacterized protein n=1 Tax=Penicillium cinerascens TaxID=70096 RepID=A0A9W9T0G5_9EURO|nr:uncharacterized protein N7498_005349 [Penicillium cinerascens]KAJ5204470.1 hypothetical protein N7498_005349 [Penicillium cinerascens]